MDQSGHGEVLRFGTLTDSLSPRQALDVSLPSAMAVSSSLSVQPVTLVGGQTIISSLTASIDGPKMDPKVYPNPASSLVHITVAGTSFLSVQLMYMHGRLLREQAAHSEDLNMNLTDLPAGIYHLTIATKDNIWRKKLVIGR